MKKVECSKCENLATVVERKRDTVPLNDASNCYWYECSCGHKSWIYISPRAMTIMRRKGTVYDA